FFSYSSSPPEIYTLSLHDALPISTDYESVALPVHLRQCRAFYFIAPYILFSYTLVVQTITISNGQQRKNGLSSTLWVFKLFNSIKDEHEVKLAELELQSLFGRVERVRNFYDIMDETHLKLFSGN